MPAVAASDGPGRRIAEAVAEIERLADAGVWEEIAGIVARLPGMILSVPESERRGPVLAAAACLDRVRARAGRRSDEIASQLETVRAGRRAADNYRAHEQLSTTR
jgi:hypothetical protein